MDQPLIITMVQLLKEVPHEQPIPCILRIIPRLRPHDPLPGDYRGTFGNDRSSDLSCEWCLSEQLRPRLPRALRRLRDLPGHPHRSRPRQQGQQSPSRHPASRARAERFRGWLGYGRRRGSRHSARSARRLCHQ